MDLEIQLSAGTIKRYHTVPLIGEQTVAHHTYNVVQILRYITGDMLSVNLIKAALDHDVLEYFTGDIPHPTKKNFPGIDLAVMDAEMEINNELGVDYELTIEETQLLRWADILEAGSFGRHQAQMGNSHGGDIIANVLLYFRTQDDMPELLKGLVGQLEDYFERE